MTTIGTFAKTKDGVFKGAIRTLTLDSATKLVRLRRSASRRQNGSAERLQRRAFILCCGLPLIGQLVPLPRHPQQLFPMCCRHAIGQLTAVLGVSPIVRHPSHACTSAVLVEFASSAVAIQILAVLGEPSTPTNPARRSRGGGASAETDAPPMEIIHLGETASRDGRARLRRFAS